MGFQTGEFVDTNSTLYTKVEITVTTTSTTISAELPSINLDDIQMVRLYNKGSAVVLYGPPGEEVDELFKRQNTSEPIKGFDMSFKTSSGSATLVVTLLG